MKPYMGKVLLVDLSTGYTDVQAIPDEVYENYLSGAGLGAWWLYSHIPAGADPLGPENILAFTSGMLTGSGAAIMGRWMVLCKSPLTGGIGEANCGGTFAPGIKRCGFDAIFVSGIAENPVYLYVDNKGAQLRDASHIWGKDAVVAEDMLTAECAGKKKPVIATIGQAGENGSLISGICNDRGRIAARSGVGAVMGGKKLKAVVLCGTKALGCEDPETVKSYSKRLAKRLNSLSLPGFVKPGMFSAMKLMPPVQVALDGLIVGMIMKRWGTSGTSTMCLAMGDTPIKNWAGGTDEYPGRYYRKIDGSVINARQTRKYYCYSCFIGCGGVCDIGTVTGGRCKQSHKPEYETQMAFGSLLMASDPDAVFTLNEYLNRAGMDTISCAHTVAMAIECYENGILTKEDTGGLVLRWGDTEAIIKLVEMMVNREGIGDILADGTKKAAERIGKGAERFAVNAGGQEPGMHDSRADPQLAVHYSTDATPGRHTTGGGLYYGLVHLWERVSWAPAVSMYPKKEEYIPSQNEARKVAALAYYKRLIDAVGGCYFGMILGVSTYPVFDWLNSATNRDKTPDEYMTIGRRIHTLRQMFNIKHGIDPWEFRIPSRMAGEPPLASGKNRGMTVPIDELMKEFWECAGWDRETGVPLANTLEELGMNEFVKEYGA